MGRIWRSVVAAVSDAAYTLANVPLYAKVLLALPIAAAIVLIADWTEIFPSPPSRPIAAVEQPRPPVEARLPEPAVEARLPERAGLPASPSEDGKLDDRLPKELPTGSISSTFRVDDPHVGPDGSIRNGDDGSPFFLGDLKRFSSKDVCTRADGERWACGLHAYATLRNSLAHKAIQCVNRGSSEAPDVRCALDGRNVALILIDHGLVELADGARDADLLAAQAKAKAAHTGVWNR